MGIMNITDITAMGAGIRIIGQRKRKRTGKAIRRESEAT